MKAYVATKIVRAEPMIFQDWCALRGKAVDVHPATAAQFGYHVVYDDGYESWSPAAVFKRCYRKLTNAEISTAMGLPDQNAPPTATGPGQYAGPSPESVNDPDQKQPDTSMM